MEYNKLNVFHWHMVDAESFPFESRVFPNISIYGRYANDAIYTYDNINDLVNYAYDRGIRIIPEIDVPGHTGGIALSYRHLVVFCDNMQYGVDNIALNPIKNETYTFVQQLLTEVASLFPDAFFHIGGDEVNPLCWPQDPDISNYMKQYNLTTQDLQASFEQKAQNMIAAINKSSIVWEEVFDLGSPVLNDTIINVWLDNPATVITNAVQSGRRVVISSGWYMDRMQVNNSYYQWIFTWHDFYGEPTAGTNLTADQEALILGGEMSVWTESVDEVNFDERLWTRGPAVAERLWSGKQVNDYKLAAPRLEYFRCKLISRGVQSGPTIPSYCMPPNVQSPTPLPPPLPHTDETFKTVTYALVAVWSVLLVGNISLLCVIRAFKKGYEKLN